MKNPNGKLSKDTMLGDPDWNTFERETWSAGYEYSHSFDDWQFRQNSRYMQSRITRHETWPGNLNNAGFGTRLNMTAYDRFNKAMVYSLDNQLEDRIQLGELQNTVLFGGSFDRTSFNQDWNAGLVGPIDIYNPVYLGDPRTPIAVQNTLLEQQMKVFMHRSRANMTTGCSCWAGARTGSTVIFATRWPAPATSALRTGSSPTRAA